MRRGSFQSLASAVGQGRRLGDRLRYAGREAHMERAILFEERWMY